MSCRRGSYVKRAACENTFRRNIPDDPRRILAGIFSRALQQLAIGIVVGLGVAALLFEEITDGAVMSGRGAILLPAVAVIMLAVGLLAAVGPARRGLHIDPTVALRAEE
ncbi:MAG: hypothetical protein ACRD2N_22130 [Vicinamibacterales bacterium]